MKGIKGHQHNPVYQTDHPQTDSQPTNSRSLSPALLHESVAAEHLLNTTLLLFRHETIQRPTDSPLHTQTQDYNTLFKFILDRQAMVNGECQWQLGKAKLEAPPHPEQRWRRRMENTAQ
jgi:hypothetical protein